MSTIFVIHCLATWALAGLIWTVQLVVYPQFSRAGRDGFGDYHAAHMSGISVVVGPLMLMEAATAGWLLVADGWRGPLWLASLATLGLIYLSTVFVQVPAHRKLERDGFDPDLCRRLTRGNWVRTVAWTLRAILVALMLVGRL